MRVIHRVEDNTKKLELSMSDDRLKLFAKVEPRTDCAKVTLDDFMANLTAITPPDILEMDVVKDIVVNLQKGQGCDGRRVARGKLAEAGRDGKIVWMVRRFNPTKGDAGEREFTDLFTLGLFENVEAGTEIARIYRPSDGTAGIDVQGKELPARAGQPATFRGDKTVELKIDPAHEHYTTVVALIAGYVHEEGPSVSVRDTLTLRGNLDWSVGHIDFVGSVEIAGDVQKSFNIKARGDIRIGGNVLGDNILTSQGSVRIKGFHLGGGTSSVIAKGDYSVEIAQSVTANIGGNIYIGREARDCTLRAGLAVFAPEASIVGGTIWCVRGVEAKQLGNPAGVTTIIELRNELEVTKEFRDLTDSIRKHEAAVAALELHIGPYLKNRSRVPLLKAQFRQKIVGLLDRYDGVVKSLAKLREQERVMRESKPIQHGARVNVKEALNAGVTLESIDSRVELKDGVKGPISYRRMEHSADWVQDRYQKLTIG